MASAEQIARSTNALITLPAVYLRARAALQDPNASLAEAADVIACDPAMTARLLRIANSAFFGFAAPVQTVARAVNLLGTEQVHDLLLATSVSSVFAGVSRELVDMEVFWRRGVLCGVAARLLAARCNVLDSERLFVEGLLHEVGHLVLFQHLPESAASAMRRAGQTGTPLFRVERELLGCDYAEVGSELLRLWQLPASLQESVRWHVEPERARDFPLEVAIVHMAWCLTDAGQPVPSAQALQLTGLVELDLEAVCAEAEQHASEIAAMFCAPLARAA